MGHWPTLETPFVVEPRCGFVWICECKVVKRLKNANVQYSKSRVNELWRRGCLQFEKFSSCKKSPGERRSPYVDVGKPPTKIYRLDSWISGEMCLQRIASEMCCWVFSEMFLWNQVKTGGRLGLAMTGGNVFFDNSSIWKIWSPLNIWLGTRFNWSSSEK